jgi:flagellar hook-associated protein 3 FlgL
MPATYPITGGRVSDLLVRTRLLNQLQANQLDMLRLQDQLSTGRRISRPSENPSVALRALQLQRLLEQKE